MTRRRGLIASGIAMVALLLAMSPAENRMKDAGGPGLLVTIFATCKFALVAIAIAYIALVLATWALRTMTARPA